MTGAMAEAARRSSRRLRRSRSIVRAAKGAVFSVPADLMEEDPEAAAEEEDGEPKQMVRIPSFSVEDRRPRTIVGVPLRLTLLRSNLLISAAFVVAYVIPHMQLEEPHHYEVYIILFFILWHTFVTLLKSVPDEASSVEELNMRTNATTFVAMVLYPCVAIWTCERSESNNGVENLFVMQRGGKYQWGSVFPFFMWGMSALILVRDSYHPVAVDRGCVVTDPSGKSAIGLFRRYPNPLEALTSIVGHFLTSSLWDVLGDDMRPAGNAGRFVFQLFSPVVILFFYIGARFMLYSAQEAYHQASCFPSICLEDLRAPDLHLALVKGRFEVWLAFTGYCCLIRGLVPSGLFLRMTVKDAETRKWLLPRWREGMVESKRQRLLWSFRGLAASFVPWYYAVHQKVPAKADGLGDMLLWYLYLGVFVSFFMEGVGAIFFALHEVEHGCCLKTPFAFFTREAFWGSYNVFLQPLGTFINVLFWVVNQEFRSKIKFKEILGPLIDSRGDWRFRVQRAEPNPVTQDVLDDWVATWKRKRDSVGKSTDTLDVVGPRDKAPVQGAAPVVFEGTLLPTAAERVEMVKHPHEYVPVKPWETHEVAEKFERWYPTDVQEVLSLLREPYNFQIQHEVWVWGYGSLMSPDSPPGGLNSRQRKLMLPYWVKKEAGFRRCWNYRHGSVGINAVGLERVGPEQGGGDDICGIAYPMDYELASDLFSKREDGYRLLLLHESYFEAMHPSYEMPKGCGYVWVVGEPIAKCKSPENWRCNDHRCKRHWPTDDSPILQSYVDELVSGALRYKTVVGKNDGMNFAAALIKSTHGWDRPWVNDRILSGRPWKFVGDYELIDGLLNTCPVSHSGFLKRYRPNFCPSPILGSLFQSRYEAAAAWRRGIFGADCQPEAGSAGKFRPGFEAEAEEAPQPGASAQPLLPPALAALCREKEAERSLQPGAGAQPVLPSRAGGGSPAEKLSSL